MNLKSDGFTLIELLTVMAIMVIILSAGVASFYGMGRGARMRSAASNVNATLGLARQRAILLGRDCEVRFDGTNSNNGLTYFYEVYCITNQPDQGYQVGDTKYLPKGIDAEGVPFSIRFSPDAGASGASTFVLRDTTSGSPPKDYRNFTVYPLTGLSSVSPP